MSAALSWVREAFEYQIKYLWGKCKTFFGGFKMGNSMGYDWIFRYNHLHVHQKCIWGKLQLVWLYIHHWSSSFITCTRTWAGSFARVGRESISDSLQLSTECVLLSYNLSANSILDNAKKRCAQSKRMHSWCETNAVIDFGNMDLCHKLWISVIWTCVSCSRFNLFFCF